MTSIRHLLATVAVIFALCCASTHLALARSAKIKHKATAKHKKPKSPRPLTANDIRRPHRVRKNGKITRRGASRADQSETAEATVAQASTVRGRRGRRSRQKVYVESWTEPTYADSTLGDNVDGEDLIVRRAAVEALGPLNGSVVVSDAETGRVLTIVNQKLAFKSGYQPCSTIKLVAGLAGLSEGVIRGEQAVHISRRVNLNLTDALAHSNNYYFAKVGERLGFDRTSYYARLFGLGEKAGLGIEGEQPGTLPDSVPPGGMGMMTSFGEGITLTPLQLAALVGAVANGGTLYYLQYPRTPGELDQFVPRVKRHLSIAQWIPEMTPGMMGAVEYGTARRAVFDPNEPILGKTGTCTDTRTPTHLGWFGSFKQAGRSKLVVVVLLTGGRPVSGPVASGVAGGIYRGLAQQNYFQLNRPPVSPLALINSSSQARSTTR